MPPLVLASPSWHCQPDAPVLAGRNLQTKSRTSAGWQTTAPDPALPVENSRPMNNWPIQPRIARRSGSHGARDRSAARGHSAVGLLRDPDRSAARGTRQRGSLGGRLVDSPARGDVAQLEEHRVRIAGVRGSSPLISTTSPAASTPVSAHTSRTLVPVTDGALGVTLAPDGTAQSSSGGQFIDVTTRSSPRPHRRGRRGQQGPPRQETGPGRL
jgi:hypothetical protein